MEENKKALDVIREAMKDVIQEMVIKIDDEPQLVFIHKLHINTDGKVEFEFSTPSEKNKDALIPHIENCIKIQIEELTEDSKKWKLSKLFSRT